MYCACSCTCISVRCVALCVEAREYVSWEGFHADMLLVRDNCHTYNEPTSQVRVDCDDVFAFFEQEEDKVLHRLQAVSATLVTSVCHTRDVT